MRLRWPWQDAQENAEQAVAACNLALADNDAMRSELAAMRARCAAVVQAGEDAVAAAHRVIRERAGGAGDRRAVGLDSDLEDSLSILEREIPLL